ncbi:hypothetical protein TRFO_06752 [Tritrichomonas foetus]|uniref:Uncharacterized protein n=1 Tax=Tritrichomonas foetus TaxID=1144522 RepID=A0A1J4JVC7_9EUKA|nr:hypothetical protein TRFO_06752 [Tritrichomonas foetus]|eukprot:OHT03111.1 hypothetical protein TRFO_06752 [Tritrichomonas foetus]
MKNATFCGNFTLAPGSFTISSKDSSLDLKIKPDLKALDTDLTIDPLKHTFLFSIKKTCDKSGAAAQLDYNSENNQPVLTVFPRIAVKNVLSTGKVVVKSFKGLPLIQLQTQCGKVTLRQFYNPEEGKTRCGAFYNFGSVGPLCCLSVGVAGTFKALNIPNEAYFYTKATVKGIETAIILSKEEEQLGAEARLVAPFRNNYRAATSLKCVDKKVSGLFGLGFRCPDCGASANVSVNTETEVKAIVSIPLHKYVRGTTVALSASVPKVDAKVLETKPQVGVSLSFE